MYGLTSLFNLINLNLRSDRPTFIINNYSCNWKPIQIIEADADYYDNKQFKLKK